MTSPINHQWLISTFAKAADGIGAYPGSLLWGQYERGFDAVLPTLQTELEALKKDLEAARSWKVEACGFQRDFESVCIKLMDLITAVRKCGVCLDQGYSRETVSEMLRSALAEAQRP